MKFVLILIFLCSASICAADQAEDNAVQGETIRLTVEKAIEIALSQNRTILSMANFVESGNLSVTAAESEFALKITPNMRAGVTNGDTNIGAGPSFNKKIKNGPVLTFSPELVRRTDGFTMHSSISLIQPLLKGRGEETNLDGVYNSEFSYRTAKRNYYLSQVNTVIGTVSIVFRIKQLQDIAAIYQGQVEGMKTYAASSEIKKAVGLATPMDVFRARIRLKDVEDSLSLTLNALLDAKEDLKKLLSFSPDAKIIVQAPDNFDPVNIPQAEAIQTALSNRIEMEHVQDFLREADRKNALAKHRLLPQLDLKFDYRRYGLAEGYNGSLNFDQESWSVNLISTTDFSRTAEKTAYQQSIISVRNAKLDVDAKSDEIISEVKQYLQLLDNTLERIVIRKEQIRQARGKLELSKIKFRHGMADNFDIIGAETEIQQAEVNMISAQTEYIVGLYKFRAVVGTLIARGDGIEK